MVEKYQITQVLLVSLTLMTTFKSVLRSLMGSFLAFETPFRQTTVVKLVPNAIWYINWRLRALSFGYISVIPEYKKWIYFYVFGLFFDPQLMEMTGQRFL